MIFGILALLRAWFSSHPRPTLSLTYSKVIVDSPSTATFLTPEEKAYVIWHKSESCLDLSKRIALTTESRRVR